MLAAAPDARQAMERVLYAPADAFTEPGRPLGCMVITAAVNCTSASEEVRPNCAGSARRSRRRCARIGADTAAGRLPADTDADGLAIHYAAVVQGMSTQAVDGVDRATLERVAVPAMGCRPAGARE